MNESMTEEIYFEDSEAAPVVVSLAPAVYYDVYQDSLPVRIAKKFRGLPYIVQAACFVAVGYHLAKQ